MKKTVIAMLVIVCLLPAVLAFIPRGTVTREDIIAQVRQHEALLRDDIRQNTFERTEELLSRLYKVEATDTAVEFAFTDGYGGRYAGFFYTPDNDPSALWCAGPADLLQPDGSGFRYITDNYHYYAEPIVENFYYYEAHF